jgi:hypothetical protein
MGFRTFVPIAAEAASTLVQNDLWQFGRDWMWPLPVNGASIGV